MATVECPEAILRQILDPFRTRAVVEFCVGRVPLLSVMVAHIGETSQLGFTIAVDDGYLEDDGRWAQVGSSSVGAVRLFTPHYLPHQSITVPISTWDVTVKYLAEIEEKRTEEEKTAVTV